ncbi:MAG: hypothetical protein EOR48_33245, partial [Mesorhizobium sp.]
MRRLWNGEKIGANIVGDGRYGQFAQAPPDRSPAGRTPQVCAAPHRPAGHFSPYNDGEKDAVATDFANLHRCRKVAEVAASPLLPVTIRGEGAGR